MTDTVWKPSYTEWLDWAQTVVDRLTTCVHTYSKPPYDDVFMADKERQGKNAVALNLLRRLHGLVDDSDTPTESLADVARHDERVIDGLEILMAEMLAMLPTLSRDMQLLLKSEWFDNCSGRSAGELFRGPLGDLDRGIGSGYPEQGRLPAVIAELLERERLGEMREPRKDLHRHGGGEGRASGSGSGDHGPQRDDQELRRRWADKNKRSHGAVE